MKRNILFIGLALTAIFLAACSHGDSSDNNTPSNTGGANTTAGSTDRATDQGCPSDGQPTRTIGIVIDVDKNAQIDDLPTINRCDKVEMKVLWEATEFDPNNPVDIEQQDEVHIHGYDRRFFVDNIGATVTYTFTASIPGQFEVELEEAQKSLFTLIVTG